MKRANLRQRTRPTTRAILAGCQERELIQTEAGPVLIIRPLQFLPVRMRLGQYKATAL